MRKIIYILILLGAFLGLISLSQAAKKSLAQASKKGAFKVEMLIEGQKLKVGTNSAELVIRDEKGVYVEGALVRVLPQIYQHGESTLVRPKVSEKGEGHYSVENIYIEIPGHWVLNVTITKDGFEDSLLFDFPEVKRGA